MRFLGFGLPPTVDFGWVLAFWLVPGLDVWLALSVAAALGSTDAALGVPVVTNRMLPSRIRRLIGGVAIPSSSCSFGCGIEHIVRRG